MKICCDAEIIGEGSLMVFPYAEEMDLAADLLAPLAVVVWGEWKRGIWFDGLLPPSAFVRGKHGNALRDNRCP
jgi:hypothetical protein